MGQTLEIGFWPMGSITVSKGYTTGPRWSGNALGHPGAGFSVIFGQHGWYAKRTSLFFFCSAGPQMPSSSHSVAA